MAVWSRTTWKFVELRNICFFFEKRLLTEVTVILAKFCSESIHCVTDRRWVPISWNVADGKSATSYVIYQTKKFACLNSLLRGSRLKFARANPLQCSQSCRFHPNWFTFGWYKTKFRLALQLSLLRGSRPKSARSIPSNVLWMLQISSKLVHYRRSHSRTPEHHHIAA